MFRFILFSVLGLIAAVLIGLLCAAMTRDIYVPILTAVAMGAGLGAALGFVVHFWKVMGRIPVSAVVTCASVLCLVSFHWGEYQWHFKPEVRVQTQLAGLENPGWSDTDSERVVHEFLTEQVGNSGFVGFLQYRFKSGAGLRFIPVDMKGPLSTSLLWGIELALLMVLCMRITGATQSRLHKDD